MTRKQLKTEDPKTDPLHLKYRPSTFDEVVGQNEVVKSIRKALSDKARPHTYLFTGDSGTGKTTLARIIVKELDILPSNITEIDAASNNGIDAMREMMAPLRYHGFGDSPNKAIIIDEAHMITKQAWASLLKTIEEPPEHVYFFFCTTDASKVPDNIITRCLRYNLKLLRHDDMMDLLEFICDEEKLDVPGDILTMVAKASNGSPRNGLVMLAMVHDCESSHEAAGLLEMPLENSEVIDLCRLLVKGDLTWSKLVTTLKQMNELPAESIRIVVVAYLTACLMGAKSDKDVMHLLDILHVFSKPINPTDKLAPILLAFGSYIYD